MGGPLPQPTQTPHREVQEGEIQQLLQLVTSQVECPQLAQAGEGADSQAAQPVAGERELEQAWLRAEGAGLQGAQAVIVQVESAQGCEGCQYARFQARDAVVLQEQRLRAGGREGGRRGLYPAEGVSLFPRAL